MRIKNHILSWLALILLSAYSGNVQSQSNDYLRSLVHYNTRSHVFNDDLGHRVEMHIFRGFDEGSREFNIVFSGGLNRQGFNYHDNRKDSYIRALLNIGLQNEFDLTNMMDLFYNNDTEDLNELIGQIATFESNSSLALDFSKYLASVGDLRYIKNRNDWNVFINKLKMVGRRIRKYQRPDTGSQAIPFRAFDKMLQIFYFATATYDIADKLNLLFFQKCFLDALQTDIAILRYQNIRNQANINDPAFWEALDEVEKLLFEMATEQYWSNVRANFLLNKKKVQDGILNLSELMVQTKIAFFSTNFDPVSAMWVRSIRFAIDQYYFISGFEDDLRDAQTAMTIYKGYSEGLKGELDVLDHSILEYVQYYFFDCMSNAFYKNNYIRVLGWINKDWREVRMIYRDEKNAFSDRLIDTRVKRFLSSDIKEGEPILIGFVIDTSGSMSWTDPKNIRHSALSMIIDRLQGHEQVFLVDFDSRALWVNDRHYRNWDREQLKRYVRQLDASGGTDIGLGLDKMREVLQQHMTADSKVAVLLFTDGMGSFNNNDEWFAQNNIPVYTVGYKAEADAALMQRIAAATNGVFLLAENEQEIANTFIQFLNGLLEHNTIINQQDVIAQDQEIEYTFYVENNTSQISSSTSWMGSKIGVLLRAPGNLLYRAGGLGQWFSGKNYTILNIDNPPPGEWKAVLTGEQIPGQVEPFTFQVSGDTPAKYELKSKVDDNGRITLLLEGKGSIPPISGIRPKVTLKDPKGQIADLSSNFSNGKLSHFPRAGEGNYRFDVAFDLQGSDGSRIQRHLMASVFLGEYQPAYIGLVTNVQGIIVRSDIGRHLGNRPGIRVEVFDANSDLTSPKARGLVTYVAADYCQIEINYSIKRITAGDVVVLDVQQWQSDVP